MKGFAVVWITLLLACVSGATLRGPNLAQTNPPKKTAIGKLGQAKTSTKIYAKPSLSSHVYSKITPYQYLVIGDLTADSKFYKVRLQTNKWGYVPSEAVKKFSYDVVHREAANDSTTGEEVALYAAQFLGVKSTASGRDLNNNISSARFIVEVFKSVGVTLPNDAAKQSEIGSQVKRLEDLKPGDRLYFTNSKGKFVRCGIYVADRSFILADERSHTVKFSDLGSKEALASLSVARRDFGK